MRVFITGASSGLGEALANEYRKQFPGTQLILGLAARRKAELERVAAALPEQMPAAQLALYAVDVNDRAELSNAANDFIHRFGVPDVVIANAGISAGTLTGHQADAAVFERIMQTNVVAMFDTFAPFVGAMTEAHQGTLVGIASVAGIRGLPGAGGYSASKAAAITYLESLRLELRSQGVRVVTIAPGYIRTPMTAHNRYPMPFLTDADVFARKAVAAIANGRSFVVIPWPMRLVAAVMRVLPNWLYDRLAAKAPRKARL
jgi:short-subunit dehydrogenase